MTPHKDRATPAPPKYTTLQFENLTASEAPLLKVYYWECCEIENFNAKLKSDEPIIEHTMRLPNAHLNSHPVKIVFWVRNCSAMPVQLQLKRIKNCDCKLSMKRVGFNQYRQLYNCPHRPLVNIVQEAMRLPPDELVAITLVCKFYLNGEHKLSYQITVSDSRLIKLHFDVDIGFAPEKCILTRALLPVDAKEYRRFVQPIWVRNPTLQPRKFLFGSFERGLLGINPIMSVPGQSVWPLLVKYRPTATSTEFELVFQQRGIRAGVNVKGGASLCPVIREPEVPLLDHPCADQPYVIYPNKLDVTMDLKQYHSELICIHNFDTKCVQFRWQLYEVETMFKVSCEPKLFRIKPKHSTFCIVHIRSRINPLHFMRIPIILEIHRIFDKPSEIARDILSEVDSVDDPNWDKPSYHQHLAFQLNLKVNFDKFNDAPALVEREGVDKSDVTIFEQLFWEYLQDSSHMRDVPEDETLPDDLDYEEVLALEFGDDATTTNSSYSYESSIEEEWEQYEFKESGMLKIMGQMLADVLKDVARKWKFIPPQSGDELREESTDDQ